MSKQRINPIDALYDEDNHDEIILMNERGEDIAFEQIALIPLNEKVYVILLPIEPLEGMAEGEGLVFAIDKTEDGSEYLNLVTDDKIIDDVFTIYETLIEEEDE